jgi:gliding motility-associated-like protein
MYVFSIHFLLDNPIRFSSTYLEIPSFRLEIPFWCRLKWPPGADLNYLWTPADVLDCVTCPAVNVTPLVSTLLSVNVTDANGCTASDVMEIRIDPTRPVYVPNAFTPNFDGVNDYFIPYAGNGVRSVVSMLVFDRWGELVFEGSNLQPGDDLSGWDGTFRGKPAASGHYVYLIELEYIDGQTRILKGGIHLIR